MIGKRKRRARRATCAARSRSARRSRRDCRGAHWRQPLRLRQPGFSGAPSRARARRRRPGLRPSSLAASMALAMPSNARVDASSVLARSTTFSLWARSARRNTPPSILSNMASAASVRTASISRANTTNVARRRGVSKRERCCAVQDSDFSGDCRVARAVNALLAIRSDAEFAHGLQPFDNFDEIPLARRFRPFPQPCERRALLFFGDDEQRLQSGDRFRRQAFDKIFVGAFAGKSARRQGDLLQGDGGRKQNAPLAQMFDHRGDNRVATIRAGRLFNRDMSDGASVLAPERSARRDIFGVRRDVPNAFRCAARMQRTPSAHIQSAPR